MVKIVKKNPGNGRLNNLNDPVLNVLIFDKYKGYFTWITIHIFLSYLFHFFLEWEMFQIKVVEKIITHVLCSINFFSPKVMPFMRYVEKYIVERGRPQMKIRRMRIACQIPNATNTHPLRLCNTRYFSSAAVVARTRLNVTLYAHCLVLFSSSDGCSVSFPYLSHIL